MTRDGGTPCGCNGKSLVVVDVIYIYIYVCLALWSSAYVCVYFVTS